MELPADAIDADLSTKEIRDGEDSEYHHSMDRSIGLFIERVLVDQFVPEPRPKTGEAHNIDSKEEHDPCIDAVEVEEHLVLLEQFAVVFPEDYLLGVHFWISASLHCYL